MGRIILDNDFVRKSFDELSDGRAKSVVVQHNINAKALISALARSNIPVKIVNLGGGVKKVIKAEYICSCCNGKGYTEGKQTEMWDEN